ncbi:MAG: hypothetical protein ACP5PM_08050 [Acidimicrobiales bacterium]
MAEHAPGERPRLDAETDPATSGASQADASETADADARLPG